MSNINRLIALWMGECWHEWEPISKSINGNPNCIHCHIGKYFDGEKRNPDFSQPEHFASFTGRLFENKEMWATFENWVEYDKCLHETKDMTMWELIAFFFSDRTRFCTLFAEFLRLPETVERFGWEGGKKDCIQTCPQFSTETFKYSCPDFDAGNCTGKVLSAWARYAKEGEDG